MNSYIPSNITVQDIADAFNKWKQQADDNPQDFVDLEDFEGDYGVACANKLIQLIKGESNND